MNNQFMQGLVQLLIQSLTMTESKRAARDQRNAPKLDGSQKFDVKGQTEMFNRRGELRNFNSPAQAANRQPTLSDVPNRSNLSATPPNPNARVSPGQMNLYGQTNQPALPPAGQSGGSALPRGTSMPRDGRPVQRQSLSRRQLARQRLQQSQRGTRGNSNVLQDAARSNANTRAANNSQRLRNLGSRLNKGGSRLLGPASQGLSAGMTFLDAKDKGATTKQAATTTAGDVVGFAGGFRLGMALPIPEPRLKAAVAVALGLLGSSGGSSLLENLQGYAKEEEKEGTTETEATAPEAPAAPAQPAQPAEPTYADQFNDEPVVTPVQQPIQQRSEAPITAPRTRLRPNLGTQQVSPSVYGGYRE